MYLHFLADALQKAMEQMKRTSIFLGSLNQQTSFLDWEN